jgi:undecaprenyl diphosphate synthase
MTKVDISQQVIEEFKDSIPKHIGIIMDGNGRWAQKKGMPRVYGHKKGVDAVRNAVAFCRKVGVESLTLFAFSSENWKRPEEEVSGLMDLFMFVLTKEVKNLSKNNVRLKIIGDLSKFSEGIQKKVAEAEAKTKDNTGLTLNVAANYGGRWDIAQACQKVAELVEQGKLQPSDVNEDTINQYTSFSEQSDLDLLIRTGGEVRVSNFMLWQLAYSELCFSDVYWPDFGDVELANAIASFAGKERRFGLTGEQVKNN